MLEIDIGNHRFFALPERAIYWPAAKCLLIADLHLGKADTFRHFGIAVPQTLQWSDLHRLETLLAQCKPQRCLILGDFVHGRIVNVSTAAAWNDLVNQFPKISFELLVGNHDRALDAGTLKLHAVTSELCIDGVWLTHDPLSNAHLTGPYALNIHGHIHPAVRIDASRIKSPALVHQPPYLRMPAFSEFTAGAVVKPPCDGIWVFAPDASLVMRVL